MAEVKILLTTLPPVDAERVVQSLVEERLVACGNIVPAVRSIYVWKGELCHDEEAVLWLETASDRLEAAMARILEIHPYECPKVIALDPLAVSEAYLRWAIERTRPQF